MGTKNVWQKIISSPQRCDLPSQKWRTKMTTSQIFICALGILSSFMTGAAPAASLNKCVDAYGKVTYSNLPCKGANEVRKVEIDPAPPVPPVIRVDPHTLPTTVLTGPPNLNVPAYAMPEKNQVASIPRSGVPLEKKAAIKFETLGGPKKQAQNTCDTLTDKLGLVLDKMDGARRKGYTQKQLDGWNSEIKSLERKKQQAGCF